MQYKESLLWILDKDCKFMSPGRQTLEEQEALYRQNIDFVHALGLKCDCVGWCRMDLDRPDIDVIFAKIEDFCKRESWGVRAWYAREFTGESDWFALKTTEFKENVSVNRFYAPGRDGGEVFLERIKACADLTPGPRTVEFLLAMEAEELLETKPKGRVIAICPDGDRCLLTPDGTVERWSHEAPEVIEHFPTLAQFFADTLLD